MVIVKTRGGEGETRSRGGRAAKGGSTSEGNIQWALLHFFLMLWVRAGG